MAIVYTKAEIDALLAPLLGSQSQGIQVNGIWNWTGYGNANPSWGQLSADAAPVNAVNLYVHKNDAYGVPFTAIAAMLTASCQVWAQSVTDPQAWIKYQCTGAPTQTGDVLTVPVEVITSGPNSVENWTQARMMFLTGLA